MAYIIVFFLVVINISNIFNVIGYKLTGSLNFVYIFPGLKDLFLYIIMLVVVFDHRIYKHLSKDIVRLISIGLLYIILISFNFMQSDAPMSLKLYNLRRISTMWVAIYTFSLIRINTVEYVIILKAIKKIFLLVFFFGIIELMQPISFWDNFIDLPSFWNASGLRMQYYVSIRDAMAYTSDLKFLTGNEYRRMMSFFAEPTTLGSFFTFIFTYFSFSKCLKGRKIIVLLSFLGGLLIFSKAFLFSVCIVVIYKITKKPNIRLFYVISITLITIGYYIHTYLGKIHGGLVHFIGLYTGIQLLFSKPLGFGLGMAGNRGLIRDGGINGLFGGESGLGNVLAQLGIPGIVSMVLFVYILKKLSYYFESTGNYEYFAAFVTTINFIFIYYLSASSLGFTGNMVFFVFIGLILNNNIFKEDLQ